MRGVRRLVGVVSIVGFCCAASAYGQAQWRAPGSVRQASAVTGPGVTPAGAAPAAWPVGGSAMVARQPAGGVAATAPVRQVAAVTQGSATLPNAHGQVWREYDISPYTSRVSTSARPQAALVDWILRETGSEVWFHQPLGILSADKNKLRVYHTPQMQQTVHDVVNRFIASGAETSTYGIKLVTVKSPNWRATMLGIMKPVEVQTPGIEAWLLRKEDAAVLLQHLRKRNDFREHNDSNMIIHNGQPGSISMLRPRSFVRSVAARADVWPGYQLIGGQVAEGFSLELSPLLSENGQILDAVVRCNVDQIEKIVPVPVNLPDGQQIDVQVPQMVSWRLHERFRWPADHTLLISAGVVAQPEGGRPSHGFQVPDLFDTGGPPRADGLLFIDCKGVSSKVLTPATTPAVQQAGAETAGGIDTRGRY
jgi:hypothetical protein